MLSIVLALLLLLRPAYGAIDHTSIHADSRRLIHFSEAFGFDTDGVLEIELRDIKMYKLQKAKAAKKARGIDYKKFGFFIARAEDDIKLEQQDTPKNCALHSNITDAPDDGRPGVVLFRFNDTEVKKYIESGDQHLPPIRKRFKLGRGGLLKLHFANCEVDTPVSFKARISMYNIDRHGRKYYLSVGLTELTTVYWIMFALFTGATTAWGWLLVKDKGHTHKIHFLMLALGLFKALTLLCQAAEYHYIGKTGHPDGWNIAFYIFTSFRGLFFFTVVVLIGTGWSYMKPFLGDRERRILLVVIPLQVFANIAIVVAGEENPAVQDWAAWRDVFHLVDIICCCAVLFPIVWSIKHLREAAQTDGKAARSMEKLTLFRQFYVMVVVYIYFTRIVVYLLESTMQFEYLWLSTAASELATLAFYVWTAVKFRPHGENPYLKLHQEEIELP